MRIEKKQQRKTEKAVTGLKEFLIAMGQDPDKVEKVFDETPLHSDEKMLQAEGVLLHLLQPTRFISKTCKRPECGEVFGTSYRAVGYCSDNCRAKDLERQTGIRWNPHIDRYRNLQGERPLVIGPEAYKALIEFAQYILTENNIVVDQQIDQKDQPLAPLGVLPPLAVPAGQSLTELLSQPADALDTSLDVSPQQSKPDEDSPSPHHFDPIDPFGF